MCHDLKHLAICPYLKTFNWNTMNLSKNNIKNIKNIFKITYEPNEFSKLFFNDKIINLWSW